MAVRPIRRIRPMYLIRSLVFLALVQAIRAEPTPEIIPVPQQAKWAEGILEFQAATIVRPADYPHPFGVEEAQSILAPLETAIQEQPPDDGRFHLHLSVPRKFEFLSDFLTAELAKEAQDTLRGKGEEAYGLFIGKNPAGASIVLIFGNSVIGQFWGIQTLRQILEIKDGTARLRRGLILDWPEMSWRGSKRPHLWEYRFKANAMWGADLKRVNEPHFRFLHMLAVADPQRAQGKGGKLDCADEFIAQIAEGFKPASDTGIRSFLVKFDDIHPELDAAANTRFQGSYGAGVRHFLIELEKRLKAFDPADTLYWMPNPYYNTDWHFLGMGEQVRRAGGLPVSIGLNWCGWFVFAPVMTEQDLRAFQEHFYGPGNPPKVKGLIYDNFGRIAEPPSRHSDYFPMTGREPSMARRVDGILNERGSWVNRITAYDQMWNPEAYDPDRSLAAACRELAKRDPALTSLYLEFCRTMAREGLPPTTCADATTARKHLQDTNQKLVKLQKSVRERQREISPPSAQAGSKPPQPPEMSLEPPSMADLIDSDMAFRLDKEPHYLKYGFRSAQAARTDKPPAIDGLANEEVWAAAPTTTDFISYPGKNAPPAVVPPDKQTSIRLLYDDQRLYVFARMEHGEPPRTAHWAENLEKVGNDFVYNWRSTCLELFFDPRHDHRNYFHIIVDLKGRVTDEYLGWPGDPVATGPSWTSDMEVKTVSDEKGWWLEAAVPFKAFGAESPKTGQNWGIQIGRNGPGYTLFSVVYSGPYGVRTSEQFGHLTFR